MFGLIERPFCTWRLCLRFICHRYLVKMRRYIEEYAWAQHGQLPNYTGAIYFGVFHFRFATMICSLSAREPCFFYVSSRLFVCRLKKRHFWCASSRASLADCLSPWHGFIYLRRLNSCKFIISASFRIQNLDGHGNIR